MCDGFIDDLVAGLSTKESWSPSQIRMKTAFLQTLWLCYCEPGEINQLQVAALIGRSDSWVSDRRQYFERSIRRLRLKPEDMPVFEQCFKRSLWSFLSSLDALGPISQAQSVH